MSISIKSENTVTVDKSDFSKIEEYYGISIDSNIKNIIRKYNGDVPFTVNEKTEFKYTLEDGWEVEDAIDTVFNATEIINSLEFVGYLEELKAHFNLPDSYVDCSSLLPLIKLLGGVIYISINGEHKGSLYVADNGDFGITKLQLLLDDFCFE